jgi:hypothetical protein
VRACFRPRFLPRNICLLKQLDYWLNPTKGPVMIFFHLKLRTDRLREDEGHFSGKVPLWKLWFEGKNIGTHGTLLMTYGDRRKNAGVVDWGRISKALVYLLPVSVTQEEPLNFLNFNFPCQSNGYTYICFIKKIPRTHRCKSTSYTWKTSVK